MSAAVTGLPPGNDNAMRGHGEVSKPNSDQQHEFSTTQGPRVNPSFPDRHILPGRVLAILLTGRRYTHKDSWLELGHSRLADSIWKLRRLGWQVQMIEKTAPTSDCGRTACFGIYYLEPEAIAEAGERGQRYIACSGAEVTYG